MKPEWAELYDEHVATYYKKDGQCQNPHCGHRPIHLRHVLRHKHSGETLEIGHICFLRWQVYYGVIDPELTEYDIKLKDVTDWTRRGRITALEYAGHRKQTMRERHIKKLKKKRDLVRVDFSLSQFSSREDADKYADEHGGYCSGELTIRGEKIWCLYIPRSRL